MFSYSTSYRLYTCCKIGLGAAYLWYIYDFFQVHLAMDRGLADLLSPPSEISFSGNPQGDAFFRPLAIVLSFPMSIRIMAALAPVAVIIFIWGQHRWMQCFIGAWMSFCLAANTALVGVFSSTADIWLNLILWGYTLAAWTTPTLCWAEREPGFKWGLWQKDPPLMSTFAWLIVLIQWVVYFFAGINKLVDGWQPWVMGDALQNLAFDSSMRSCIRGILVPHWLSWLLCYVTLFQRLVVPWGFFFKRWRAWSVFILIAMHVGYAGLMYVNIFPLVGIASLLIIWPVPAAIPATRPSRGIWSPKFLTQLMGTLFSRLSKNMVIGGFALLLMFESSRLTLGRPFAWENKLMITPAWKMFADGGISAGGTWHVVLDTPNGEVDVTESVHRLLPQIWRDRFYVDTIFHEIEGGITAPNSLVDRMLKMAEHQYQYQQKQSNLNPAVLGAAFDLYRRPPRPGSV